MWRRLVRQAISLIALVLVGGFLGAGLVRVAPGFDVDDRELDPRLSPASLEWLRAARAADGNLATFYWAYLKGLTQGEMGVSRSLRRPVTELLRERGPMTLRLVAFGLVAGWTLGLGLAVFAAVSRMPGAWLASAGVSSLFLALPAALAGLLVLYLDAPRWWAVAFVILPKVFSYARPLIERVYAAPHVLLARAKGLGEVRMFCWHVLPAMAPELFALAGVSVSLACGVTIPLEAVCDIPGAGQLAWQAAAGRDLPVLVSLTLLFALVARVANAAADLATEAVRP